MAWYAQLLARCVVAIEACSGAHHSGRKFRRLSLDARMIAANFVSPYWMGGRSGNNDMTDAPAICEAASRPNIRFVPIKTCEQQAVMSLHRVCDGFKEERTASFNQICGVLAEHGLVFGKSPKVLHVALTDVLEDAADTMTGLARLVVQRAFNHWRELDHHMTWCDRQIGALVSGSEDAKRVAKITGIGEIGASAFIGGMGGFKLSKGGRPFGAWLGLVPSQNSRGGKASLGRITKRGDDYLRTLLIQGAKSAVMSAGERDNATSKWLQQMIARVGW